MLPSLSEYISYCPLHISSTSPPFASLPLPASSFRFVLSFRSVREDEVARAQLLPLQQGQDGQGQELVSNFISLRFPLTCPSLASLFKHEHS